MIVPNIEKLEQFRNDVETDIANNPYGIMIFDISVRYGEIETDIIGIAEKYGFDPEWTEEEQEIIDTEESPDNYIESINETSQKAEDYLNSLLQWVGIKDWGFTRYSEAEVWGLYPLDTDDE
jgi:hypothetical protein